MRRYDGKLVCICAGTSIGLKLPFTRSGSRASAVRSSRAEAALAIRLDGLASFGPADAA